MVSALFFGLCFVGFLISSYFTAIYLGVSVPVLNSLAGLCRIDTKTCESIIETEASHLFGVGNFILGLIYYLVLMFLCVLSFPFQGLLIGVAWFVASVSLYLAFQLYYILKRPCPLCYTSHVINFCIAIILSFI